MRKFKFIDPGMIMSVVVSLVILAVGVFAFFVVISSIDESINESLNKTSEEEAINNISSVGNDVFNIMGVVLIIGAIMAVVGVVYTYVSPVRESRERSTVYDDYSSSYERQAEQRRAETKEREKQKKAETKRKAVKRKKEQAVLKEKNAYKRGRSSRTSKAARMLDEQEKTKKRRK